MDDQRSSEISIETDVFNGNRRNSNAGRRGRGGARPWRGIPNASISRHPRIRTESWPAPGFNQNLGQHQFGAVNFQGRGHSRGGATSNFHGRGAMQIGGGRNDFPSNNVFTSFSYAGPPPPIAEPNFYFEAENWRPMFRRLPPSQTFAPPINVRPISGPSRAAHGPMFNANERMRSLEKPFSELTVQSAVGGVGSMEKDGGAVPKLLAQRELGLVNRDKMKRRIAEIRVQKGAQNADPTVRKLLPDDFPGESLQRCQFMEATPDGTNIFGSWALRDRDWSRIMCTRVETKERDAQEGRYGINLTPTGNYIYVMDKNVVDLCQARMDNSVTCVLYVTVPPSQDHAGSRIFLQPVPELCETKDENFLATPIFNAHWMRDEEALSCAWDFTQMRFSLGLERYGMILDVVSEKDFKLFSCHKSVLTQKFSRDGSLLFMGVRDSKVLCCDLRRQFHHAVYALPQQSVCWLHLMADSNYMIAADFSGQIKLWDLRMQRVLRSFDVPTVSDTKLPVVVDEQDSLIFAVGDDGATNAWSLKTGKLLRQISRPQMATGPRNLPRLCYSGCWGGVPGNAAVALGVGDEAHFYELQL